jgi:hypothetical protein
LRIISRRIPPSAPLELLVYGAALAPTVEYKVIIAAFLAGAASAGVVNLAGKERLRLIAFTVAYIGALAVLGAWGLVVEFYSKHGL